MIVQCVWDSVAHSACQGKTADYLCFSQHDLSYPQLTFVTVWTLIHELGYAHGNLKNIYHDRTPLCWLNPVWYYTPARDWRSKLSSTRPGLMTTKLGDKGLVVLTDYNAPFTQWSTEHNGSTLSSWKNKDLKKYKLKFKYSACLNLTTFF